jgi:hypothetical protein
MEDNMAIDAVCWFIFASAIGLFVCGCYFTLPEQQLSNELGEKEDEALDRAA